MASSVLSPARMDEASEEDWASGHASFGAVRLSCSGKDINWSVCRERVDASNLFPERSRSDQSHWEYTVKLRSLVSLPNLSGFAVGNREVERLS